MVTLSRFSSVRLANPKSITICSALDFDIGGILETASALDDIGILHAGSGTTRAAAWEPVRMSRHGVDMMLFSFSDYGNGHDDFGSESQAATATRGGFNYLNTHGIRRLMPFGSWDRDMSGVIDAADVSELTAAAEAAGDPDASNFAEVLAFLDQGYEGTFQGSSGAMAVSEEAGDGRVTLAEFDQAHQGIEEGNMEPGWIAYVQGVAQEMANARSSDELIIATIHWAGNWSPLRGNVPMCRENGVWVMCPAGPGGSQGPTWFPAAAIRETAHLLIEGGVDIIQGGSSHHLLGVEIYNGSPIIYGCGPLIDDYWHRRQRELRPHLAYHPSPSPFAASLL